MKREELRARVQKLIGADANPDELIDAIKRKDASYLRGAIQWYERKKGSETLVGFLKKALSASRSQPSSSSQPSAGSSSSQ